MLEKKFHIEVNRLLPRLPKKIAVAVSGGADSMSMILLAKTLGTKIIALIVDHGLRAESANEAKSVQSQLKGLGIETVVLNWEGSKPKSNIHENARRERYKLLTDYCISKEIKHLLVAHTKNDQAETVMLRIYRGSGVDGISAMREKSVKNGVVILRPLLGVNRVEIEAYLKQKKVSWVNDPSNSNTKFERVKIRQLLGGIEEKDLWLDRLCLLAENAQRSSSYIKKRVNTIFTKIVKLHKLGFISVDFNNFQKLNEEIALKILVKIIDKFNKGDHQPRLSSLKTCLEKIKSKKDFALAKIEIKHVKGEVIFIRELSKVSTPLVGGIWDDRFIILNNNSEIKPLGEDGWKQIKSKVIKKNWPHIKVLYTLPTVFEKGKVTSCPLLGIGKNKLKVDLGL